MEERFDVIVVGGSYAGLSAAMALGRSKRKTLVVDNGKPCNRQTPYSHNFLTQDGQTPAAIAQQGKEQLSKYPTVQFYTGLVTAGKALANGFEITINNSTTFTTRKLLFATGMKDIMPPIDGFSECWGISVLHCPYCHGYEVKDQVLGVMANGDFGFEFVKLISNWTKHLTLLTNGKSTLTEEQTTKLITRNISIVEEEVASLQHTNGHLQQVHFTNGSHLQLTALFAKASMEQHCRLPEQLGCIVTEQGFIEVDEFKKTSVKGIYAAGDNTTMFRSVAMAVGAGNVAGAMINKDLIAEEWT